jgi:CubicO group peptidase (beta-lactamase class C family)
MDAIEAVDSWPATTVAAGWCRADDAPTSIGPADHVFALASVTKPLVAYAVLIAVEEGSLSLDAPAGPAGSTVAHLLSHSSGLAPEYAENATLSRLATRRIYSNYGYEILGLTLETATDFRLAAYLSEAVLEPLGMDQTRLIGSPAHGASSSVNDLLKFGAELLNPTLISTETLQRATGPHLPDLIGVLPGFGRQNPNTWGLGFEIKHSKQPHWTGTVNSPATFGHFGRSGTFFWLDPEAGLFCTALTDKTFGPWAAETWPVFSDLVVSQFGSVDTTLAADRSSGGDPGLASRPAGRSRSG